MYLKAINCSFKTHMSIFKAPLTICLVSGKFRKRRASQFCALKSEHGSRFWLPGPHTECTVSETVGARRAGLPFPDRVCGSSTRSGQAIGNW